MALGFSSPLTIYIEILSQNFIHIELGPSRLCSPIFKKIYLIFFLM